MRRYLDDLFNNCAAYSLINLVSRRNTEVIRQTNTILIDFYYDMILISIVQVAFIKTVQLLLQKYNSNCMLIRLTHPELGCYYSGVAQLPLPPTSRVFCFYLCTSATLDRGGGCFVEWCLSHVDRHSSHCDQDSESPYNQTNYAHRKPAKAARLWQVWKRDCVSNQCKQKVNEM